MEQEVNIPVPGDPDVSLPRAQEPILVAPEGNVFTVQPEVDTFKVPRG
jgi:hypothetical protein